MSRAGVILYGPPASGKDTITGELARLDPVYAHFQKLKVGSGRSEGYRLISDEEANELRRRGLVLYENERYGNRYIVDRPSLDALFAAGRVPIVHMGQVAGVRALQHYPATWLSVLLWCPREITEQRAQGRNSGDVSARLTVWDETALDIEQHGTTAFTFRIDTDRRTPVEAAHLIHARLTPEQVS